MRIVLLHPSGSNWVPGQRDVTPTVNRMAPIGLLSVAAWLRRGGHQVSVVDCLGPNPPPGVRAVADAVLAHRPDLVGVSATTSGFLDGAEIAAEIKDRRPEVVTIFGGVHPSAMGPRLLEDFPEIDYLCLGEGEVTISELASGEDPPNIKGLAYRDGDRGVATPPRTHLPDLDDLPFPAYELLDGFPRGYNLPLFNYIRSPGATMITSRGCPFQCSYCDRSVYKKGFRYNSAEYVHEHLRYLRKRFGVRHVNIYDDLFTANRRRIAELCERLAAEPLGMQFNCAVRVGHTDPELLQMLRRAGCLMVSIGAESGDAELLERHKAGVSLEQIRETVEQVRASGLRVKGLFMMGLPGETEESIRRTSDFVLSLDLDDHNMSKFTPFPGAPVWSSITEHGSLREDWRLMNCLNFVFLPSQIESLERLDELYNRHVKRFYTAPQWRRRFRRNLWQHRWSLWHLVKHLPTFLAARRHFEPRGS